MRSHLLLFVAALASIFAYSCSTTEKISQAADVDSADSGYPSWYERTGVLSDSSNVVAHAMSIASDSTDVVDRATSHSLQKLEVYLGDLAEEMRFELEKEDHQQAASIPAILELRNANTDWGEMVIVMHTDISKSQDSFKGFVALELSKDKVLKKWKRSLSEYPAFFEALSSTSAFRTFFQI